MTVNPNITEQEGSDFFAKKSCAFIGSDNHVQILSMPSNAGVKSLSFISTPCKIYSHRNYHFFVFFFFFLLRIYKDGAVNLLVLVSGLTCTNISI